MPLHRKRLFFFLLLAFIIILSISCGDLYPGYDPALEEEPQAESNPEPPAESDEQSEAEDQPETGSDEGSDEQSGSGEAGEGSDDQHEAEAQPQHEPDPEPEMSDIEKCDVRGDILLETSETETIKNNGENGELDNLRCEYTLTFHSDALDPVVLLYEWHQFDNEYELPRDSYHWKFHRFKPVSGFMDTEFKQELVYIGMTSMQDNYIRYSNITSYVAVLDTDECRQYINDLDVMQYRSLVQFDCDEYLHLGDE